MTLSVGSRLGAYEILARLGAGGMGEVYRVRDTRLHRELAMKVLPASVAEDPGFLARFQSEARSASALNHPNIVTIHDVGSSDGVSYILMELVEGKTVRELLDRGAPPLRKVVQLAAQAADGLAAAHTKGIVHRDLKPENLIVSKDGVVKILDFGIAKATPLTARPGEATETYVPAATQPGTVLGTVGYMSPEQASGRAVDFRSDQFALGTILHELLTGKRAWKRDSAAETLTAIIREDPQPPIATAAPGTPTALRWIVERCLAKDPEERYASTRDLARDLSTLQNHLSESSVEARAEGARPSRGRRAWLLGALGIAAAAGLSLWLVRKKEEPAKQPEWTQVGFRRGTVLAGRFTPDAQTIVYSAAWDGDPVRLFSIRPGTTQARTLDLPPGKILAISAKSELAFLREASFIRSFVQPGILVRAGLEGGTGRDVLEDVTAADWSSDGLQLAVTRRANGKNRLEYPLGKTLFETNRPMGYARISPNGEWIAFSEGGDDGATVEVLRVSDGQRRVLSKDWWSASMGLAWSADGREIWFTPQKKIRDSSPPLMAVDLSGREREVLRAPGQLRLYDIAADGRVLLARWDVQVGLRGADPTTSRERDLSATDDSILGDLSADGRTVLIHDREEIFLRPTDGSPPLRLSDGYPGGRLSPDGKWVLAVEGGDHSYPVLIPVGAGDIRRLEPHLCEYADWLSETRILCEPLDQTGKVRVLAIELASGKATEIPISEDAASDMHHGGLLSPDRSTLAVSGRDGGLWIVPLNGAGGTSRKIAASADLAKGTNPAGWTTDGRQLFVAREDEVPMRVRRIDLATGRVEPWKTLAPEDLAGVGRFASVRVVADGRSWAYTYMRVLSNLYVVEGLR
jgi:eukaryotic-like serine/threonine-protein kinase